MIQALQGLKTVHNEHCTHDFVNSSHSILKHRPRVQLHPKVSIHHTIDDDGNQYIINSVRFHLSNMWERNPKLIQTQIP